MSDISAERYRERFDAYEVFEEVIAEEYGPLTDVVAMLIRKRLHTDIKALDVGCGTGRYPVMLASKLDTRIAFDYLDPSQTALDRYEAFVPRELRGKRILGEWGGAPGGYDLIVANNSLCGVQKSEALLFRERLTRGGLATVTLPSKEGDWVGFAQRLWRVVHGRPFGKTVAEDLEEVLGPAIGAVTNEVVLDTDEKQIAVYNVMMYAEPTPVPFGMFREMLESADRMRFTYKVFAIDA